MTFVLRGHSLKDRFVSWEGMTSFSQCLQSFLGGIFLSTSLSCQELEQTALSWGLFLDELFRDSHPDGSC